MDYAANQSIFEIEWTWAYSEKIIKEKKSLSCISDKICLMASFNCCNFCPAMELLTSITKMTWVLRDLKSVGAKKCTK